MCFPMLYIFIFMFANDLKIRLFCKVNININPQISVKCELWVNTGNKPPLPGLCRHFNSVLMDLI